MSRAGPTLVLVLWGVVGGRALDVRVNGDVVFAMQLSAAAQRRLERAPALARAAPRPPPAAPPAPALACRFRFPHQEQVDAILSNMMNELTKVFVRANHFLKSEDNTRNPGVWRAEDAPLAPLPSGGPAAAVSSPAPSPSPPPSPSPSPSPPPSPSPSPSPLPSPSPSPSPQTTTPAARSNRFKVVDSKKTQFFEHIFHNMTEEFRSVHNESSWVARARGDPCARAQQAAARRAWRALLRRSLAAFRRAALNCVQEYLKIQECEERTKARLVRFLMRELSKMRARHLQTLCDRFQLCLDEGLLA